MGAKTENEANLERMKKALGSIGSFSEPEASAETSEFNKEYKVIDRLVGSSGKKKGKFKNTLRSFSAGADTKY